MAKNETCIRKLVGRIGSVSTGKYYCCDYIFKDGKDFHGAVATVLTPVSKGVYEDAENAKNREVWQEQVRAGATEQSLQNFLEEILVIDFPEGSFDFSGYEYWDELREIESELIEDDFPAFDCTGGGRSFSTGMKFDKIYDQKLFNKIMAIETTVHKRGVKR